MKVESLALDGAGAAKTPKAAEAVELERKAAKEKPAPAPEEKNVQAEEVLDQIKALTEDGSYSVRFERDDRSDELVVRLVDRESGEVVRQIPSEELLDLTEHLQDLRGNLVNTAS